MPSTRDMRDRDFPQAAIHRSRIGCLWWYHCGCKGPGSIPTPGGLLPGSGPVQGQHSQGLLIIVWRGLEAHTAGRPWLGPTPAQGSCFEVGILYWTPPELQLGPADPDLVLDPQLTSLPGLGPCPRRCPVPQAEAAPMTPALPAPMVTAPWQCRGHPHGPPELSIIDLPQGSPTLLTHSLALGS